MSNIFSKSALRVNSTGMGYFSIFSRSVSCMADFSFIKKSGFLLFFFSLSVISYSQAVGDYRSIGTGTWTTLTTWERLNALPGTWATPTAGQGYPGQFAVPGTVTIQNNNIVTLNVSPANNIGALTINNGNANSGVVFNGFNLTVNGATTINANTNAIYKYLQVDAGTFTTGSVAMTSTNNDTRDCYISISTGSVTVIGNLTMNSSNLRNYVLFTGAAGAGNLYVGGTMSGGGITSTLGGTATGPTTGTIDFNGAGAQTIPSYNYYNLTISNARTTNNITLVNGATIGVSNTFDPTATFTTGGYINTNNTIDFNGNLAQTIPAFNYNNLTISGARTTNSITLENAGTIGVANTFSPTATFTTGGFIVTGSTVNFNGNVAQNIPAFTFNNLSAIVLNATAARIKTVTGTVTVNGDLTITGTSAANTIAINSAGLNFTVNGNSNINSFGILNDDNNGGVNTFVGLVTISANGSLTSIANSNYIFRGGISNNGTFTKAGTGSTTFNVNPQSLSGNNVLTFSGGDITISDPVTLDVSTDINFSGTNFTNNSNAVSAFNATSGTFTFLPNAAQNINGTGTGSLTFYNLVSSGGNTKTTNQVIDVANLFTVNTGVTFTLANAVAGTFDIGGASAINGTGTLNLGTVANIINMFGSLTVDGTLNFGNVTGVKTVNLSGDLINVSGTITMTGALAHNLNLGGANNAIGTFNTTAASGSTVNYNGAGDQQVFASANYRNLTISGGGNKTLQGAVTVNNIITFNTGVFQLGNYNLTVVDNTVAAFSGTLNALNMVETNGTGYIVRNANATKPTLFPVGSAGYYAPVTINASAPTTGTISIRTSQFGALGAKYVQRIWDALTSAAGPYTITATFNYNGPEATTSPVFIKYRLGAGAWTDPTGTQSMGVNSFTITGTTNITNTNTSWAAGAIGTYYSYQTGSWNTPTTWTSDPGGTTQVGSTVPDINDVVVILSGRTVSLPANIATTGLDVTINSGSYLDMSTFQFTAALAALRGQGTLKLASVNFPTATINPFINTGGGTTEYYNAANFTLPVTQNVYNNLTINTPGVIATQMNNITLNGNLYIDQGTFRINDNTNARRQLTINGNVLVDNGASFTVGTGVTNTQTSPYNINGGTAPYINYYDAQSHRIAVYGNFTNNGTVRFTNLNYPIYNSLPPIVVGATSGYATVYFLGATNNTLTCNNTTDFYNLVLDKGIDQTFTLTVYSSAYTNFRLFGANIAGGFNAGNNPDLRKALWIRTGSLVLQGLTVIPSLSEGTCGDGATPNSDFYIPANGALVLDGPNVIVNSTADDYREVNLAYGVAGPSSAAMGIGTGGCSSFSILGRVEINDGYFSTKESGGFITWDWASGQFIIDGGQVDAKQYRAAGGAGGLSSFRQTGGIFYLRGRFQRTPTAYTGINNLTDFTTTTLNTVRATDGSLDGAVGTFNLNNAANVYIMSGGTIQIYDACGAASGRIFDVFSSSSNINVTGGTVIVQPITGTGGTADAGTLLITSNAPLGYLTINRISSASIVQLNTYPLIVQKHFNIASGVFNANNLDVSIGANFTIGLGTTYTPGTNRTIFNGTAGVQLLNVNLATPLNLNKLIVDKAISTQLRCAGTQNTINVADSFLIIEADFLDQGKIINCSGNIYNSGVHSGTGRIVLNSNAAQTIDGDGTGIFQNLELNKPLAGAVDVTLRANITLNGILTFSGAATGYKRLNLQEYNLLINSGGGVSGADNNRYAYTKGEVGNGSISKVYSTTETTFTFPIGAPSTSHVGTPVYTPATIGFTAHPTAYGTVTVVPVGAEHFATNPKNRSLSYYWRVLSSGFAGIVAGSINQSFTYDQTDVRTGVGITEAEYVPARFDNASVTWSNGTNASINTTTNLINGPWLTGISFLDGDYTAGDNNPTNPFGTPLTYYSRNSGWWGNVNNWSLTNHTTDDPPGAAPGASDIVIIGNGHEITLNSNNTVPNTDVQNCANLKIEVGASLDIGYNPGCTFSVVSSHPGGNGLFRLTTSWNSGNYFVFPSGDFSDFNVNLGTTELYSTNPASGTTYWMPNNITKYGNLIISPLGGSNIIFGNTNVLIYGNCITQGQNADSWFLPTWSGNYPDLNNPTLFNIARVAKTITINGDLDIQGGAFGWYGGGGGGAQNVVVYGDVLVASGAGINVWNSNTSQSLSIGGSLINNSNNAIAGGVSTRSYVCLNSVTTIFFGSDNATVTTANNTAYGGVAQYTDPATPLHQSATIFGNVIVNKGSSQSTTLTFNGGTISTPVNNWLTLQNGTVQYRLTNPRQDLTISTTTALTIPGTAGLEINLASNVSNTNVLICNANDNAADLYLGGKLSIGLGNVYVGPTNGTTGSNNDIEYSGGGLSEIALTGGTLVVNGQIRMNAASTAGVLKYSQSGASRVIINGQNATNTKAKLEIFNPGSTFNMSGSSSLTIVRGGGGNTYGDLYLRPESSSVSGTSTVLFSQIPPVGPVVDVVQSYLLDATVPLNNLTITGKTAATARNATVTALISPLTVNGDLTISNGNSILDMNTTYDIDLTVKGGFTNNGAYNHYNNLTTFSGGVQSIQGTTATDFYDLLVNPVTSLSLIRDITVLNDLTLSSGQLLGSTFDINVRGDIINNANYDGDPTQGGVILNGSSLQYISGTGTFGRLEINNVAGARTLSNISLQRNLIMTNGILDINQYLFTLGVNSAIEGSSFSTTKMITSDGVYSNVGLRKYFGIYSGVPQVFTYPMGTSGKYTPAVLTFTDNTNVGYIRLNNINDNHPGVIDPNNVLDYFWDIESNGILGFNGTLELNYLNEDVQVTGLNSEVDYIAAALLLPGTSWTKSIDNVDETNNRITFLYTGANSLSGEYTAGVDPALPDEVPEFTSIDDGDWSDQLNWTQTAGDPYVLTGAPNGFIVIVDSDDLISVDINYASAYRTTINGNLRIESTTFGHNLGNVSGSGTLTLENASIPAGRYSSFFDCSNNATLEYAGTGTYTLIADLYSSIPYLHFTGTGTRVLPNKDLTICTQLLIDGPTLDNSVNNRKLTIQGTMERYNTGSFNSGSGAGAIVSFAGATPQTIGGVLGDFTGSNDFNNFEINNINGVTINNGGAFEVAGNLILTQGNIVTTQTNTLTITNTAINCVAPVGGSSVSFVDGPLTKRINQGDNFAYPVGKGTQLGNKITLSSTQTGTILWTAEYFTPNASYSDITAPLTYVNSQEYWTVSAISGSQAVINLRWDPLSDLTPLMTENGLSDMRVAVYNTGSTSWEEIASTATGTTSNGTVYTLSRITIPVAGTSDFTLACINITKPRARLNPSGPVCGNSGIPVSFTGVDASNLNYILTYTIDGVGPNNITVNSLPFILPTGVTGATYQLTTFSYNNPPHAGPITTGVVDPATVTTFSVPTTADAGLAQSLCGATSATLNANTPVVGTGLWNVQVGAGGTVVAPTDPDSDFNGTNGTTYTLRWTISNGTCTSFDDVVIDFPLLPLQPGAFTLSSSNVCQGQSAVGYTVPNDPTVTYAWAYTGTGETINGSSNSVNLDFDATATSGTLSVNATNGCGTSADRTIAITVNAIPTITLGVDPVSCSGIDSALILYSATTQSPNQFSIGYSAGAIAQGFVNITNSPLSASPVRIDVPVAGAVGVYNADYSVRNSTTGCSSILYPITITINATPSVTITGITIECEETLTTLDAGAVFPAYQWSLGGTPIPGETNQTIDITTQSLAAPTNSTIETYSVIVTDANGCEGSDTHAITVYRKPDTGPQYHIDNLWGN